jgi:hypothetical protein
MARRLLSMLLLASSALSAQTLVGPNLYFFVDQSTFSAEGSWVPVNPKDHAANQTETELDCEKRTGECIEASADYYSGHPHISVAYFQIIKWDINGIVATNADAICVSRTVSIGFAAKPISDTREAKVLPNDKQISVSGTRHTFKRELDVSSQKLESLGRRAGPRTHAIATV